LEGDIITRIDDRPVGDGRAAMNFIMNSRPGEKVTIDVFRNGQELKIEAVLGSEPQTSDWLDEDS
jgi:serine protease DegS